MDVLTKIERTLASESPKLTPAVKNILAGIRDMVRLNPLLYPSVKQKQIVDGQYKRLVEKPLKDMVGL